MAEPLTLRILLPLDGTEAAEQALAVAEYLSEHCRISVLLLHSLEAHAHEHVHGQRHLSNREEAEEYLHSIEQRIRSRGIEVASHVHTEQVSDVAGSIAQHGAEFNPSFILMVMHGSSPFHGFLHGGIAQQVLRLGKWPILLLPTNYEGRTVSFKRVLFPVDGFHNPGKALEMLSPLVDVLAATVQLLTVVPPLETGRGAEPVIGRLFPSASKAVQEASVSGATQYLAQLHTQLPQTLRVESQVCQGDVREQILSAADNADLVCLTSHGQSGWIAKLEGSIAQSIVLKAKRPLLLVRAE